MVNLITMLETKTEDVLFDTPVNSLTGIGFNYKMQLIWKKG